MANTLKALRGMNDLLPKDSMAWQNVESIFRELLASYAYQEIRTPVLEPMALFCRGVGETTDIVSKEMYAFTDNNGDQLCLRPEGTAGCVRAGIEHGLLYNQVAKLWYMGPMYRHERPQKGRYRQFYHLGVEAFGVHTPDIDAEMFVLCHRLFKKLGILDHLTLELNTLGNQASRAKYHDQLVAYLELHHDELDEESKVRLHKNPLRILDSKNPKMQSLIKGAPAIEDALDDESIEHITQLRKLLDALEIAYVMNPTLVRGLDYYTHTVFEWTTDKLGAQATVCAGGRYNGLVELLGGQATPAIGFAVGIERVLLLLDAIDKPLKTKRVVDVYLMSTPTTMVESVKLAEQLRTKLPELNVQQHHGTSSFKSQFKRADKSGAVIALILGDDEVKLGKVGLKFLREDRPQESVSVDQLYELIAQHMASNDP